MRTTSPFEDHLLAMIEPAAADLGYDIVRIRVMSAKHTTLQIMAERQSDGGMSAKDCERLSRALGPVFDAEDPIAAEYDLEISSPGIDRPLTRLNDFERWKGWDAKLELDRLVEGRKRYGGVLAGIDEENICLDMEGETDTVLIPFAWVSNAKLVLTDTLIRESLKRRGADDETMEALDEALTTELETDETAAGEPSVEAEKIIPLPKAVAPTGKVKKTKSNKKSKHQKRS